MNHFNTYLRRGRVCALGHVSICPHGANQINRILVVPAQLGDVLICTPLIRAARTRWPDARIDVLGFTETLDLLAGNPIEKTLEARAASAQAGNIPASMQLPFFYTGTNTARVNVLLISRLTP